MSGDGTEDVKVCSFDVRDVEKEAPNGLIHFQIPLVFLYSTDADVLMKALQGDPQMQVILAESSSDQGTIVDILLFILLKSYTFVFRR